MLSNVKKTLARKLGADSFVSQDNTDDVRKVDDDDHVCFLFLCFFSHFVLIVLSIFNFGS